MVLTQSKQNSIGTIMPAFTLTDVLSGESVSSKVIHSYEATVVMFICNHCPYVKRIQSSLVELANTYKDKGVFFIAINSNDYEKYEEDSPENMIKVARENDYPFPYLIDEDQQVAKSFDAVCTPDFFVYNSDGICKYRGQLDDARPGSNAVSNCKDLSLALDSIINQTNIDFEIKPSVGCSIKWK